MMPMPQSCSESKQVCKGPVRSFVVRISPCLTGSLVSAQARVAVS